LAAAAVSCLIIGMISLIISLVAGIGLLIAGFVIFKEKIWGPILGIICSVYIIFNALISLILSTALYKSSLTGVIGESLVGLLINLFFLVLVLNIINIIILLYFQKQSSDYWKAYYDATIDEKSISKEEYGNCPRCKCSEVKFVDGVKYKCVKCGYIY
jgi:hypothetical protein